MIYKVLRIINPNNMGSVGSAMSIAFDEVNSDKDIEIGVQKNNKNNTLLKSKIDNTTALMKTGINNNK